MGSESGSNVFDWDGTLQTRITQFRKQHPHISNKEIYEEFVRTKEIGNTMNQISPRIFESIAAKTVLVLFEGNYSNVVQANKHFIPLKKDGSNLYKITQLLQDKMYVDEMANQAYQDIVVSNKYSYRSFVHLVDNEIENSYKKLPDSKIEIFSPQPEQSQIFEITSITKLPLRAQPQKINILYFARRLSSYIFSQLPIKIQMALKPMIKKHLRNRIG